MFDYNGRDALGRGDIAYREVYLSFLRGLSSRRLWSNSFLLLSAAGIASACSSGGSSIAPAVGSRAVDGGETHTGSELNGYTIHATGSADVEVDLSVLNAQNFSLGYGGSFAGDKFTNVRNLVGGSGDDVFTGGDEINRFEGGLGDDELTGGGGVDTLVGGLGVDTLDGGDGDDRLTGGGGADVFVLSDGLDIITDFAAGNDSLSFVNVGVGDVAQLTFGATAGGHLQISYMGGSVTLMSLGATSGTATTVGMRAVEGAIFSPIGGTEVASDEVVVYRAFTVEAPALDSRPLAVDLSQAVPIGSGGSFQGDTFTGVQNLVGGDGDDTFTGNVNDNTLSGGKGADKLDGREGDDTLNGGDGNDTIIGFDDNDILNGDGGDDDLSGGSGNDILFGGSGTDTIDGGDGDDTASYASDSAGVTVALSSGTVPTGGSPSPVSDLTFGYSSSGGVITEALGHDPGGRTSGHVSIGSGGDAEGDMIIDIENLIGGSGDDFFTGNEDGNELSGGLGADKLDGGAGDDTLTGGGGADTFMVSLGSDRITDYAVGDVVSFSASGLSHITSQVDDLFLGSVGGKFSIGFDGDSNTMTPNDVLTFMNVDGDDSVMITDILESAGFNTGPTVVNTSGAVNVAENSVGSFYTVMGSDSDHLPSFSYRISGGADSTLFSIDSKGEVSFNDRPDFEMPQGGNTDNVYDLEVIVSDGFLDSSAYSLTVTVTDVEPESTVNMMPVFSAGVSSSLNLIEEMASSHKIDASDDGLPAGSSLTYSLGMGTPSAFSIDSSSGILTVGGSLNYETLSDKMFTFDILATDGDLTATHTVNVTVANDPSDGDPTPPDPVDPNPPVDPMNTAPMFDSGLGTSFSVSENMPNSSLFTVVATDDGNPAGSSLMFDLVGEPTGLSVSGSNGTGTISIASGGLDYDESTGDSGNEHVVTVVVSDGSATDEHIFTISVGNDVSDDVNLAPVFAPSLPVSSFSITESVSSVSLFTIGATDDGAVSGLTYELIGDATRFSFNASVSDVSTDTSTVEVSVSGLDFEVKTEHVVTLVVTDSGDFFSNDRMKDELVFTVTVANDPADDGFPYFTSTDTEFTVFEGQTGAFYTVTASDSVTAVGDLTFDISGGADSSLFTIDNGSEVSFVSGAMLSTDEYDLEITVTDSDMEVATQTLSVSYRSLSELSPPVGGLTAKASEVGEDFRGFDTAIVHAIDGETEDLTVDLSGAVATGVGGSFEGDIFTGQHHLSGGSGDDIFTGSDNANRFWGGAGRDDLVGGGGGDSLFGGAGNDILEGGAGADVLHGGAGIDLVSYADSSDGVTLTLENIERDDMVPTLTVVDLRAELTAEGILSAADITALVTDASIAAENTRIGEANAAAAVHNALFSETVSIGEGGEAEGDRVIDVENIQGSDFADKLTGNLDNNKLYGGAGNDTLDGGGGNDWLFGDAGADTLAGGAGFDIVDYTPASDGSSSVAVIDGITLTLADGTGTATVTSSAGSDANGDMLESIESVIGGTGDDVLTGNNESNELIGGLGDDILSGAGGADGLFGNTGNDTIMGGAGNDYIMGGLGSDVLIGGDGDGTTTIDGSTSMSDDGTVRRVDDFSVSLTFEDVVFEGQVVTRVDGKDTVTVAGSITYDASGKPIKTSDDSTTYSGTAFASEITTYRTVADTLIGSDTSDGVYVTGADGSDTFTATIDTGVDIADYSDSSAGVRIRLDDDGDASNYVRVITFDPTSTLSLTLTETDRVINASTTVTDTVSSPPDAILLSSGVLTLVVNDVAGGDAQDDVLVGIEGLIGSIYDDVLIAGYGDNILEGGAGGDYLDGGGNDISYEPDFDNLVTVTDSVGETRMEAGFRDTSTYYVDTAVYDDDTVGVTILLDAEGDAGTVTSTFNSLDGLSKTVVLNASVYGGEADGDILVGIENLTGGSGDDFFITSRGSNVLIGNGGNDVLISGDGVDTLDGGAGDDLLIGGAGSDDISGGAGNDTASYVGDSVGVTVTLDASGSATITTSGGSDADGDDLSGIENLIGGYGNDKLVGNSGDNIIEGGAGNDELTGGGGTDTLSFAGSVRGVTYNLSNQGSLDVDLSGFGLGTDTITGFENLRGGAGDDVLTGDSGMNIIYGGAGDDILNMSLGGDTYNGGSGLDSIFASVAVFAGDTLTVTLAASEGAMGSAVIGVGSSLANIAYDVEGILGGSSGEVLIGNAEDNVLDGGSGDDTLTGGAGADIFIVSLDMDTITDFMTGSNVLSFEDFDLDSVTISSTGGNLLVSFVDSMDSAKSGGIIFSDISATSGDAASVYTSMVLASVVYRSRDLFATSADEALTGGLGIDSVSYENLVSGVVVTLDTDGDADSSNGAGDTLTSIESLIGSNFDDIFVIGAGVSSQGFRLSGGAGDDVLGGGSGGDILDGGSGIDTVTYSGDTAGVTVTLDDIGSASGTAQISGGLSAGDVLIGVENLVGGSGADELTGNSGDNILRGGVGSDTLTGGAGSDTASYEGDTAGVTINLGSFTRTTVSRDNGTNIDVESTDVASPAGGDAAGDTLIDIENLIGGSGDDKLEGDSGDNVIEGGAGADIIDGGFFLDKVITFDTNNFSSIVNTTFTGSDTASYASDTAGVTITLDSDGNASGTAQISGGHAAGDTLIDIENLIGGSGDDVLTGRTGANILEGGAGADTIDGGFDIFFTVVDTTTTTTATFTGSDTAIYAGSDSGVTITLDSDGNASGSSQISGGHADGDVLSGIEHLTGSAYDDKLWGNANDNILEGGAGSDVLYGGVGHDTASYAGDTAGITVTLVEGNEAVGYTIPESSTFYNVDGVDNNDAAAVAAANAAEAAARAAQNDAVTAAISNNLNVGELEAIPGDATVAEMFAIKARNLVTLESGRARVAGGDADGDALYFIENITGGSGDDALTGNSGNNQLIGGAGDDNIRGLGGRDYLEGGAGNDIIIGGDGDDVINAGSGNDTITLTKGYDSIDFGSGRNTLDLSLATKGIIQNAGNDALSFVLDQLKSGNPEGDLAYPIIDNPYIDNAYTVDARNIGLGIQRIRNGDNIETVIATNYDDVLYGYLRSDIFYGGTGNDEIHGAAEADKLHGQDGNDKLYGESGDDILNGGLGDDLLDGGEDFDTVDYSDALEVISLTLAGGSGTATVIIADNDTDRLVGIEGIIGSDFNDVLTGNEFGNEFEGAGGTDIIDGGAGSDTASYASDTAGVTITLEDDGSAFGDSQIFGGDATGDKLVGIENLRGGFGVDILTGNSGDNSLEGGFGADIITGGGGIDTASYASDMVGVTITLQDDGSAFGDSQIVGGDSTGDKLTGIENLRGGFGADELTGNRLDNKLEGGRNIDILRGLYGDDKLYGGGADDVLEGGAGDDILYGEHGNDVLVGGFGDDILFGGRHDDTLTGGSGADLFIVSGKHDTFVDFNGAEGDTISFEFITDTVNVPVFTANHVGGLLVISFPFYNNIVDLRPTITFSNIFASGSDEAATMKFNELVLPYIVKYVPDVFGTNGNVVGVDITDSAGIVTDEQAERLFGGAGDDTLTGNGGDDTFMASSGNDTITDFASGTEILSFRNIAGIRSADDANFAFSATGAGKLQVTFDSDGSGSGTSTSSITFENISATDATAEAIFKNTDSISINYAPPVSPIAFDAAFDGPTFAGTDTDGDRVDYSGAASGIVINFSDTGEATGANGAAGGALGHTLTSIEDIIGSKYGDTVQVSSAEMASFRLDGGAGNDILVGGSGSDTLLGGAGDDRLRARGGTNVVDGGIGNDTVSYVADAADTADAVGVTITLGEGGSAATIMDIGSAGGDTLRNVENIIGTDGADILVGNSVSNVLEGNGLGDILDGAGGDDTLSGGAGSDTFLISLGDDIITDFDNAEDRLDFENLTDIRSVSRANFAYSATGDGKLRVHFDNDGNGAGTVTSSITFENITATDATAESVFNNEVADSIDYAEAVDVRRFVSTDTSAAAVNDTFTGTVGNDYIDGKFGDNTLWGGAGRDVFIASVGVQRIRDFGRNDEAPGGDLDILWFKDDATIDQASDLSATKSGSGDLALRALSGTIVVVINTYAVDDNAAAVVARDKLIAQGLIKFYSGIEALTTVETHTGSDANSYSVSALPNDVADLVVDLSGGADGTETIIGSGGTFEGDTFIGIRSLVGGLGDDTFTASDDVNELDGGGGNNTVSYENSAAGVTINLGVLDQAGGHAQGDALMNIDNVIGSAHNDTLNSGSSRSSKMYGLGGDDDIIAIHGVNHIDGGSHDTKGDTLKFFAVGYGFNITLAEDGMTGTFSTTVASGRPDGFAQGTIVDIENIDGSSGADIITGNSGANVIKGNNGNDTIEGGAGDDELIGGAGDDILSFAGSDMGVTYSLSDQDVTTGFDFGSGLGTDTVSGFEGLRGGSGADKLVGDTGDNIIEGGAGNDILTGGAGDDTLSFAGSDMGATYNLSSQGSTGVDIGSGLGTDTISGFENLLGGSGDDVLTGDGSVNILDGGAGDDTLDGGAGDDELTGGVGDDILNGGAGDDELTGGVGADTFVVSSGSDTITDFDDGSISIVDVISFEDFSALQGIGDLTVTYNSVALGGDIVFSVDGMTTSTLTVNNISDAAGSDSSVRVEVARLIGQGKIIFGPAGEHYEFAASAVETHTGTVSNGNGVRVASDESAGGTVNLSDSSVGSGVGSSFLGDTFSGIMNLRGGSGDDVFTGGDATNNRFIGGAGADTLSGGAGDDRLDGGAGNDILFGGVGDDVLNGGADDDTFYNGKGNGNDEMNGGAGDDTFVIQIDDATMPGSSTIRIVGGAGSDTIDLSAATDGFSSSHFNLSLNSGASNVQNLSAAGFGIGSLEYTQIENFILTNFNDRVGVNSNSDIGVGSKFSGGLGNDELAGGIHDDTLDGGADNDKLTGEFGDDTLIGGVGDDTLMGGVGSDTLIGGDDNDILIGGAGSDTIIGGGGNDTASYASNDEVVTIILQDGGSASGTVQISGGHATGDTLAGIENLIGTGGFDVLVGNASANILEGGLGSDTIIGGGGNDTASYASDITGVTVILQDNGSARGVSQIGGGDSAGDDLRGIENLLGGSGVDTLTGNASANIIEGGAGASDTLNGGGGNDTLSYAGSTSAVTVTLGAVADNAGAAASGGDSAGDTHENFENILGSRHADKLTGNAEANVLEGGAGDDILEGGAGADTIMGGAGVDTVSYAGFTGDLGGVTVTLGESDTGTATIGGSTENDATGDIITGVENILGSANVDTLTGNSGDNIIEGGGNPDVLDGGLGNDTLSYAGYEYSAGAANQGVTVTLGAVADNAGAVASFGDATADTHENFENILGSQYNDTLTGNEVANKLIGGAGDDTLDGGVGDDTLTGGAGSDTFVISADSGTDIIMDFDASEDRLDFSGIAGVTASVNLAAGFTAANNKFQITFDSDGDSTADDIIIFSDMGAADQAAADAALVAITSAIIFA